MKIDSIKLKNFRGYRSETEINFNDLTVFVGKNDIGKSTILEALDIFFNDGKGTIKLEKADANIHESKVGNADIEINEVTEEYHDELYSFIEFQGWKNLYVQGKPTRLYKRIGKTGSIINEQKVLTEYIRHQIHHPENQNNPRYTREELKQSIDLMRIFIEQQSTGGISEP